MRKLGSNPLTVRQSCGAALLLFLAFGVIPSSGRAQSSSLHANVQKAWRAGHHTEVIEMLGARADSDTLSADLLTILGRSHQALHQHERAVQVFEAAQARGDSTADRLAALGESYRALGALQKAEAALQRALEIDGSTRSRSLRLQLAAVYEDRRNWDEAASLYASLLEQDSTNTHVRTRLAQAEMQRKNLLSAIDHFRTVHQQNPRDGGVALSLSRLLVVTMHHEQALGVVRRSLEHHPEWAPLWRRHADVAFQLDSLALAEQAYEHTLQHGDSSNAVFQRLGIVRVGREKHRQALPPLRTAYRRDSTQAATSFYLGSAYQGVDSLQQAITAYERAVDLASEGTLTDALTQIASTYAEVDRLPDALDAYRLVLRLQPERAHVYFHLATLYDEHYRDKSVADRHYKLFLNRSSREDTSLHQYARDRLDDLRPTLHFQRGREDSS